jgi:hypothetical protein
MISTALVALAAVRIFAFASNESRFPPGWDQERVERLIAYYDELSEDEQVAEDETAVVEQEGQTVITVPDKLLLAIRQLFGGFEPNLRPRPDDSAS